MIKKLEGVEVDYSSYLNTSIYQPLPSSVRDDEEISVIITLDIVNLMDAYEIFGDWNLAIASYNCGAGNVRKAIRRSGGSRRKADPRL